MEPNIKFNKEMIVETANCVLDEYEYCGKTIREWADLITNLKTNVDVRPVVRGRWIEHYEPYNTGEEWIETQYGYECSICGRWEYEKEPFCNCGADMREEN